MSTLKRINELEREREELVEKAKSDALLRVNEAMDELRTLGFEYEFRPANVASTSEQFSKTRRRTGIREHVFSLIEESKDGMSRGDILNAMHMVEKNDQQAVSNALAALKRKGRLSNVDGRYTVIAQ